MIVGMFFEEFLVFIGCSIFFGARLNESLKLLQGVRVLLYWREGEEGDSNETLRIFLLGEQHII